MQPLSDHPDRIVGQHGVIAGLQADPVAPPSIDFHAALQHRPSVEGRLPTGRLSSGRASALFPDKEQSLKRHRDIPLNLPGTEPGMHAENEAQELFLFDAGGTGPLIFRDGEEPPF